MRSNEPQFFCRGVVTWDRIRKEFGRSPAMERKAELDHAQNNARRAALDALMQRKTDKAQQSDPPCPSPA